MGEKSIRITSATGRKSRRKFSFRQRWLFVHGVDVAKWCKRHDLTPFKGPCFVCKAEQETTLPFAVGGLRGLAAPVCACGHPNPPYCVAGASLADIFGTMAKP